MTPAQPDLFGPDPTLAAYPMVWHWRKWPRSTWDSPGDERKGQPCRVLAFGALNSVAVEFVDGYRMVSSRYGVRERVR